MTHRIFCFVFAVCFLIFAPLLADEIQQRRDEDRRDTTQRTPDNEERDVQRDAPRDTPRDGDRRNRVVQRDTDRPLRDPDARRPDGDRPNSERPNIRRPDADREHDAREHDERAGRDREDHGRHVQEVAQRIEHMHIAAKHLQMAGEEEIANDIRRRAEEMQRDMHQGNGQHELHEVIRELQKQVEQLRQEVRELHEKTNRR